MPIEIGIPLRKDEVLKRITEEQIFEKYLQLPVDESVSYCNPLRIDNEPGCKYYRDNYGKLRFKDFSKRWNWDCFSLVQFIHNCSFIDALRIIVNDFKLNKEVEKYELPLREYKAKERHSIKVSIRSWEQGDINYWRQYNISLDLLEFFNVYPVKGVWFTNSISNTETYYRCKDHDPCYDYHFTDEIDKLYFPNRKKKEARFITNAILTDYLLQGELQLPEKGDILIITKSYKDVMSLRSFGLHAVAPQSETQYLTQEQYDRLSKRFNKIISLADNDSTGRLFAISHLSLFQIPYFVFPFTMEKDFSDNVKKQGVQFMRELINKVKKNEGFYI